MNSPFPPILVSGASSGIGKMTVERLAGAGQPVFAGVRSDADLKALETLPFVTAVRLDVTNSADIRRLAERIQALGCGLYGLVNNAGISDIWPLMESADDDLYRVLQVNLFGLHNLTRAMFPYLRECHGRIVNISSIAGIISPINMGAYAMSKHALETYSDILMQELHNSSVRVSLVEPGNFNTNSSKAIKSLHSIRLAQTPDLASQEFFKTIQNELDQKILFFEQIDMPIRVVDAIFEALFSDDPKPRYLATRTKEQFQQVLDTLLNKLVQVSSDSVHGVTRQELHDLLDDAFSKVG